MTATIDDLKKSLDDLKSEQKKSNVLAKDRFVHQDQPIEKVADGITKTNEILEKMEIEGKKTKKEGDLFSLKNLKMAAIATALTGLGATITAISDNLLNIPDKMGNFLDSWKNKLLGKYETPEEKRAQKTIASAGWEEKTIAGKKVVVEKEKTFPKTKITEPVWEHLVGKKHKAPGMDIVFGEKPEAPKGKSYFWWEGKEKVKKTTKEARFVARFIHGGKYRLYGKKPAVVFQDRATGQYFIEIHTHVLPRADLQPGTTINPGTISGYLMSKAENKLIYGKEYNPHQDIKIRNITAEGTIGKILSTEKHMKLIGRNKYLRNIVQQNRLSMELGEGEFKRKLASQRFLESTFGIEKQPQKSKTKSPESSESFFSDFGNILKKSFFDIPKTKTKQGSVFGKIFEKSFSGRPKEIKQSDIITPSFGTILKKTFLESKEKPTTPIEKRKEKKQLEIQIETNKKLDEVIKENKKTRETIEKQKAKTPKIIHSENAYD